MDDHLKAAAAAAAAAAMTDMELIAVCNRIEDRDELTRQEMAIEDEMERREIDI
ncbi:hypothetical protein PMI04_002005 [Sphingobium sp. AP49]|uniref:hypothetical protein n=1 Tax=Sphingobium sp. AP49 TaxID=1144307 RepID=UPI00026ED7A3|nr:hypothetical protein [Sphingobium sp. AP49]WHO39397.1 hypothetical protein PMI04_002005 [Sphingobium sp. AP49]